MQRRVLAWLACAAVAGSLRHARPTRPAPPGRPRALQLFATAPSSAAGVSPWNWEVVRIVSKAEDGAAEEDGDTWLAVGEEAPALTGHKGGARALRSAKDRQRDTWLDEHRHPPPPSAKPSSLPQLNDIRVLDETPEGSATMHLLWSATEDAACRLAYQCLRDARLHRLQGDGNVVDFVVLRPGPSAPALGGQRPLPKLSEVEVLSAVSEQLPAVEGKGPAPAPGDADAERGGKSPAEEASDARLMTSVLTRARERDSIYRVVELLLELCVHGVSPNVYHFNTILQGCKRKASRVEWQNGQCTRAELAVSIGRSSSRRASAPTS